MTWENLKTYVGARDDDDAFVTSCYDEAVTLVEAFIGSNVVPASAKDRAVLETGSELYHRKNAPNGVAQFSTFDGSPIRVARDPMVGAYPILARWVVIGL